MPGTWRGHCDCAFSSSRLFISVVVTILLVTDGGVRYRIGPRGRAASASADAGAGLPVPVAVVIDGKSSSAGDGSLYAQGSGTLAGRLAGIARWSNFPPLRAGHALPNAGPDDGVVVFAFPLRGGMAIGIWCLSSRRRSGWSGPSALFRRCGR